MLHCCRPQNLVCHLVMRLFNVLQTVFFFTGIISTTGSLDRESKDHYILDVYAQVEGAPSSMRSPFQVVVMVSDENDNSPSFEKQEYKVSLQIRVDDRTVSDILIIQAHGIVIIQAQSFQFPSGI